MRWNWTFEQEMGAWRKEEVEEGNLVVEREEEKRVFVVLQVDSSCRERTEAFVSQDRIEFRARR